MSSWRKFCSVATVIVMLGIVALWSVGSPISRYTLKQQTLAWLEAEGYTAEEINAVHTVYQRNKQPGYVALVEFAGDSEIHYYIAGENGAMEVYRSNQ